MYKITIEKIGEVLKSKNEYSIIWQDENWKPEWGYIEIPNYVNKEQLLYTQVLMHDNFDIKKVIDAFNQDENIGWVDSIK